MDDPRTTQALRELAELYLSPKTPPRSAGDTPSAQPATGSPLRLTSDDAAQPITVAPELLIAGHLPGPSTLWLNQYAQRIAQNHPHLATLHLTEDDVALDLFSNTDIPPADLPQASLPEIINALASHVTHWQLHLMHPTDPFAHAAAHQTSQWTLLSGCDEAAVVAGYRMIKLLLEGRPGDCPAPQVSVMFLGCDMHDAQIAFQRLVRTSREHLQLTPSFAGCQQQMLPVRRKRLGHFPLDDFGPDSAELLATLTDLPIASAAVPSSSDTKPRPSVAVPPPAPHISATSASDSAPQPAPTAAAQPQPPQSPPASPDIPAPNSTTTTAANTPTTAALTTYLPSLSPLAARCPRHPHIELALDDAGRLHLIGRDDPASPDIIPQLLAVKLWAVEHLQLLALTAPDHPFDLSHTGQPIQHIFTERAKHLAPLAHAGPPDHPPFKLHLLLPVTVADHTTYTSVELN